MNLLTNYFLKHPSGCFSRTQLRKLDLRPIADAVPEYVVLETGTMGAPPDMMSPCEVILEDLGNCNYLIPVRYYEVYRLDQTEPLPKRKSKGRKRSGISSQEDDGQSDHRSLPRIENRSVHDRKEQTSDPRKRVRQ